MRLTPKEPDIKIGVDGFAEHDQLGRKDTGDKLSRLVENLESPTVIALNGSWGSGKSFFLKCWCGEHMKKENGNKAEVIYFDAFEHDFLDDPLIALTMAISEKLEPTTVRGKAWEKAKQAVPLLARLTLRTGVAVATGGLLQHADKMAEGMAKSIASAATDVISDEANTLIDKTPFWEEEQGKLAAMKAFKEALQSLVTVSEEDEPAKPLVIIIDELDRCRPDYALSMLEVMKHFFAVDGVHFVLGVNLKELENSVQARYGKGIDAARYLQKFVHVEMRIEKSRQGHGKQSDYGRYFEAIAQDSSMDKKRYSDINLMLTMANYHTSVSLRDIERILTKAIVTPAPNDLQEGERIILSTLIILSVIRPSHITKAREKNLKYNDLEAIFLLDGRNTGKPFENVRDAWRHATMGLSELPGDYRFQKQRRDELFSSEPLNISSSLIADYLDAFEIP